MAKTLLKLNPTTYQPTTYQSTTHQKRFHSRPLQKLSPPESVLITSAGWKREDLPEKVEKAGLLSIVNEDQTVKVGIHVRPPHSEEMEFRNSSSGNLAGLLNKGLYPTEMSIRKLAGIRSYFFEGAIKQNNFTSWMRNYYVPGKKATYVLFVSRGQGSDWPDLSTMLKIDDEESPLADTPYAEFEGKVKFVFEDFQKNARRRPGFEEPDLSDQRD